MAKSLIHSPATPLAGPASPRKQITDKMTYVNKRDSDSQDLGANADKLNQGPDGMFDKTRSSLLGKLNALPNRGLKK